jgi:hypothetical protein
MINEKKLLTTLHFVRQKIGSILPKHVAGAPLIPVLIKAVFLDGVIKGVLRYQYIHEMDGFKIRYPRTQKTANCSYSESSQSSLGPIPLLEDPL